MKAPHEDRGTPARDGHPPAASRPEPVGDTAAEPVRAAPRLDRRSVQRLASGGAGNKAVAGLVAQRYASVVKPPPARAPGFAKTQKQVAAKKRHIETHRPAATESKSSQDAAVAPPDDKEAQGKAAQAEKMNAAKPGEFDKAAFVKAVNEAIAKQAPKNLDEADKFSDSDKADKVKGEVDGQVGQGKEQSAKDIETTTKAAPDTSKAKEKKVTPMAPDQAPANPGAPDPAGAVPDKQPAEVTDFSEEKKATDQEMADAEVTEDQLKKGNEPQFDDAVAAKKEGEKHSSKAPGQARTAEEKERDAAKEGAAAAGTQAMEKLTATRQQAGKAVDGGKGETKSKDEQQRAQVTAKLQKVFDAAKKDVESTLSGLDKLVDDKFTAGEKEARDAFTADHKKRMKAYKDKRYSGFTGKLKWAKDKLVGMPAEANDIFAESRKLYVSKMQGVISDVADVIGVELGKAKDRIAQGRQELKAEVDKLPADLKKFGEEAAKDFAGKFDDLETQVDEKSQQLVTDLAQKYTDALNKIDEEIKKLQEENKGLWDKVKDAVVGAIKTILELKDMLLGVLAKAASAVMKIIKDPIGFLKNLVSAVGDGLKQFMQNIGSHLKKGLVSWLLGVSASAGIEIPAKFDLKGIIQLIASLLGLTWENLKSRIMRKGVPDEAMNAVETSVPVAAALAKEGPAGAVDEIAADVGDLKATLLEKISSFLIPTVLIAGITWVISLFNPASAFIKAVKAIIDIVTFIVTQGAQIIEFVNTVLDAVIAIADGAGGGVPGLVENALAKSIPVLIGVLAALLGVGGLANKVKNAVQSLSKPVNRAIDKVIDKIAAAGKKIWNKMKSKLKGKDKNRKDKDGKDRGHNDKDGKGKDDQKKSDDGTTLKPDWETVHFSAEGQAHRLFVKASGTRATLMVASKEQPVVSYLNRVIADEATTPELKQKAEAALELTKSATVQVNDVAKLAVHVPKEKEDAAKKKMTDEQKELSGDQKDLADALKEVFEQKNSIEPWLGKPVASVPNGLLGYDLRTDSGTYLYGGAYSFQQIQRAGGFGSADERSFPKVHVDRDGLVQKGAGIPRVDMEVIDAYRAAISARREFFAEADEALDGKPDALANSLAASANTPRQYTVGVRKQMEATVKFLQDGGDLTGVEVKVGQKRVDYTARMDIDGSTQHVMIEYKHVTGKLSTKRREELVAKLTAQFTGTVQGGHGKYTRYIIDWPEFGNLDADSQAEFREVIEDATAVGESLGIDVVFKG